MRGVEEEVWLRQIATIGRILYDDLGACVMCQVQEGSHLVDDVVGAHEFGSMFRR